MKLYEAVGNTELWGKRFKIKSRYFSQLDFFCINNGVLRFYKDNKYSNCANGFMQMNIMEDIEFVKTIDEKFEELADKKYTFYNFKESVYKKLEVETTFSTLKNNGRHTTLHFEISSSEYDYNYIDLKFEDLETIYNFAKEIKDLQEENK